MKKKKSKSKRKQTSIFTDLVNNLLFYEPFSSIFIKKKLLKIEKFREKFYCVVKKKRQCHK